MAETILNWQTYAYAIAGGIIPSLIWLWFWLHQDRESPEPTGLIALSFFAGMAVVYFVLPLQKLAVVNMSAITELVNMIANSLSILPPGELVTKVTTLAFIEEFAKYATVFLIASKSRFFDEPLDAVMYLITAALGFAAMENILYILKDITNSGTLEVIGNGNMRFLGATLVHTASSAFIGVALAFSFYAPKYIKIITTTIGILAASLLHAYFNLSIIIHDGTLKTLLVFSQFWAAIIVLIIMIAIIKRLPIHITKQP